MAILKDSIISGSLRVTNKIYGDLTGNADSATKLGSSNIGSSTQPIYLVSGVPTACTYSLAKSVPSNADFTNTTYTLDRNGENVRLNPSSGSAYNVSLSNLINGLSEGSSPATADDYIVCQYAGGGTTTTTYHRRKASNVINSTLVKSALGTGSGTTKYLREDGTWQTPAYPTVNNATLTITQNGTSKGTFTANASTNNTIALSDTTYSDGTGITIGTGNVINHSNSVTAQNTQALYPIKIDAQGHISAYGTAVTSLPASNTTNSYSATGTVPISGTGVAAALGTLDVTGTTSFGAGKTISAWSETDGKISITSQDISITKSQVSDFPTSMTPTSHTHGNIQNGGTLQTNDITIESGDKIVVTDSNNSSKIARTSVSFDGSTANKCLTQKGTWESFTDNSGTVTSVTIKGTSPISVNSSSAITTSGTRTISHATSGVTAGTYATLTVNSYGHVTSGSNYGYYAAGTAYVDDIATRVPAGDWYDCGSYTFTKGMYIINGAFQYQVESTATTRVIFGLFNSAGSRITLSSAAYDIAAYPNNWTATIQFTAIRRFDSSMKLYLKAQSFINILDPSSFSITSIKLSD